MATGIVGGGSSGGQAPSCWITCCPIGGGSGIDMCPGICSGCALMPCDICVTIDDFQVIANSPDCGSVMPAISPWAANIRSSTPDPHVIGYLATVLNFYTGANGLDNRVLFTNWVTCDQAIGGTWHFAVDYISSELCTPGDGELGLEDTFTVNCNLSELFGTHTIELNTTDNFGQPYTIRVVYTIAPGRGCGITVGGCPTPISRWLHCSLGAIGLTGGSGWLVWTGSRWETTSAARVTSGDDGHLITGYIERVGGVFHGHFVWNAVVIFDAGMDDLANCLPDEIAGTDGGTTWTASAREA